MALLTSFTIRNILSTTRKALISSLRPYSSAPVAAEENDAPVEMENPYKKEKRQCILCKLNITPDYKNYRLLSQFQSPYTGRIYGRHITGLCKAKQALVESEIRKAQNCAYLPYYYKKDLVIIPGADGLTCSLGHSGDSPSTWNNLEKFSVQLWAGTENFLTENPIPNYYNYPIPDQELID